MKKILSTRVLVKICVLTTILLVLIIYTIWGNSALMVSMVNISSDRIASVKEEITTIYHENRGRYGYRRITAELRKRTFSVNHKTVQRLMKELGLVCRVRMKKYLSHSQKYRNRMLL